MGRQGQQKQRRRRGGSSSSSSTQLIRLILFLVVLLLPQQRQPRLLKNLHGPAVAVASVASSPLISRSAMLFWKTSHPFVGKVAKSAFQRTCQALSLKHPTTLLTSLQGIRTCTRSSSFATTTNITNTTNTTLVNGNSDNSNHTATNGGGRDESI
jgi:hypothetical protein